MNISDLNTYREKITAVSKKTALDHLQMMIESLPPADTLASSHLVALATLCEYFTPRPSKASANDRLAWCRLAVAGRDRDTIAHVWALDGDAWATDGHRLHLAKGAAAGVPDHYELQKDGTWAENKNVRHPLAHRVIPERKDTERATLASRELRAGRTIREREYICIFRLENGDTVERRYNAAFLDELLAGIGPNPLYYDTRMEKITEDMPARVKAYSTYGSALRVESEDGQRVAVIMPLWY